MLLFSYVLLQSILWNFRISISPDPTEKANKKLNNSQESKTVPEEEDEAGTPLPPPRDIGKNRNVN